MSLKEIDDNDVEIIVRKLKGSMPSLDEGWLRRKVKQQIQFTKDSMKAYESIFPKTVSPEELDLRFGGITVKVDPGVPPTEAHIYGHKGGVRIVNLKPQCTGHRFVDYQGLSESYRYCDICNEREE